MSGGDQGKVEGADYWREKKLCFPIASGDLIDQIYPASCKRHILPFLGLDSNFGHLAKTTCVHIDIQRI
ncbi:MAG: hypothetical protein D3908_14845 [Candidatus Electrothrix sp. AUS4]|nr:hypothetical protein [Candidatus Electrothrix sp. AUS4]